MFCFNFWFIAMLWKTHCLGMLKRLRSPSPSPPSNKAKRLRTGFEVIGPSSLPLWHSSMSPSDSASMPSNEHKYSAHSLPCSCTSVMSISSNSGELDMGAVAFNRIRDSLANLVHTMCIHLELQAQGRAIKLVC